MHPAPSVLLLSVLSGPGFGMLALLGFGIGPQSLPFWIIGFALAVAGLVSSTFHLGHPERAWRAFSQWRTSWLSREGVVSVAALGVLGLHVLLRLAGDSWWPLGWIGGALALLTVFSTSMIYMSLRTIPRWNHWSPPVVFLAYALAGGALLVGQVTLALTLLVILGLVQVAAWIDGDRRERTSDTTIATATGLGDRGTVRAFEPPHTGPNYLTQEMMFRVARKHAVKLRVIAVILAIVVPIIALVLPFSHVLAAVAVISHLVGAYVSRWLFFAEARHVVGLYYGH